MATPVQSRPTLQRYLGNSDANNLEVHDLRNEKPQCQIDQIVRAGHAVVFSPDTLQQARSEGYDAGAYCIAGSTR